MKKSHILLLFALGTLQYTLAQQVIYVDASNNTGMEDGTQAHPFNTIIEGISASQDGYSLYVATGTYEEEAILIDKCISITGNSSTSTMIDGTFILSSKLDTLPVTISNLRCMNIMHSDSGYTQTPLMVMECNLQSLVDPTSSVAETGWIHLEKCIVTDSIHIANVSCLAERKILDCETEGGLWVSSISSHGSIRLEGNQVAGNLSVITTAKSDTIFIINNTISDSLIVLSTASDPDLISGNTIGNGVCLKAVAHTGFRFMDNHIQSGSLEVKNTALSESTIGNNTFLNGGIHFQAVAGDIIIRDNEIHTDGSVAAIRFKTTAGGYFEDNTITLPYFEPSGLPFEDDTASVCGIHVESVSFGGMTDNTISGGAFGVYLKAIASHDFKGNKVENAHYGLYLETVSGRVDSNRVEHCIADGMILNYDVEYGDTNAILMNHNIIRNNGGHGIWLKGNALMGRLDEPGTGYNTIKDNGGYDLYVETPSVFADTIWAQNNEWSHGAEAEVGVWDIFDASDDPARALVMYKPLLPFGVSDFDNPEVALYPNPTSGKFQIRSSKNQILNGKLEITDLSGKKVMVLNQAPGTMHLELDISLLPSGIYFIQINLENQAIVKKIIKR